MKLTLLFSSHPFSFFPYPCKKCEEGGTHVDPTPLVHRLSAQIQAWLSCVSHAGTPVPRAQDVHPSSSSMSAILMFGHWAWHLNPWALTVIVRYCVYLTLNPSEAQMNLMRSLMNASHHATMASRLLPEDKKQKNEWHMGMMTSLLTTAVTSQSSQQHEFVDIHQEVYWSY